MDKERKEGQAARARGETVDACPYPDAKGINLFRRRAWLSGWTAGRFGPEVNRIYHGRAEEIVKTWPDNFIDAVVTDPPYGLGKEPHAPAVLKDWIERGYHEIGGAGFMGKKWDNFVPQPALWKEVYRVMKPGAHLVAFSGTRTYDWMIMSLRLAGFEVRDMFAWLYGSGFPKSLDIAKAMDKKAGVHRGKAGKVTIAEQVAKGTEYERTAKGRVVTEEAKQWEGWGTALKPAIEPIVLCRKPISEKTVIENVRKWGTGAINIQASMIGDEVMQTNGRGKQDGMTNIVPQAVDFEGESRVGRWPTNVLLDEHSAALLDAHAGKLVSRFFYTAKASTRERNENLEHLPKASADEMSNSGSHTLSAGSPRDGAGRLSGHQNIHPTVKPLLVMQYLIKLITPPKGLVFDPFLGSGTTAKAAKHLGNPWIGTELEEAHVKIGEGRMSGELF